MIASWSERDAELRFGVFGIADPGVPEQAMVEGRAHERAAVVGVLARECLSVADTDDSACGIMAEDEGRVCDRGADRLEARGGTVIMRRLISPFRTRVSWYAMASMCQFDANASLDETIGKIARMKL